MIPAIPIFNGSQVGHIPPDFKEAVTRRMFFDPDPNTGVDRSLRKYIQSVSYGRAWLDIDVFPPVTVAWAKTGTSPDPSDGVDVSASKNAAIAASQPAVAPYAYVMVVFPGGFSIRSWAFPASPQGTSYVFFDNPLGAWAMELLHIVTVFWDLYQPDPPIADRPLTPGNLDEMDTAAGMHPSTFTKLRMGWLDPEAVLTVDPSQGVSRHVLHPLARLQPAPPGRTTAIKIAFADRPSHYLLVEAREWLDEYDRNTPQLSDGVPLEGLAVYDVDESIWPPLWLKAQGLVPGSAAYEENDRHFKIEVEEHLAGGGFRIAVSPLPEPERCIDIRNEITADERDIRDLQQQLHQTGANKGEIMAQIRELQGQIRDLRHEGENLSCTL